MRILTLYRFVLLSVATVALALTGCQQPPPARTPAPTAAPNRTPTTAPSPTSTPAALLPPGPTTTPIPTATSTTRPTDTSRVASVAQVGNFSIAVRKIERDRDSAVVHFVITKVISGATGSGQTPQKLQITLKDDHNNQYSGTLTTDLSGAPPEVVLHTPLGFSYTDSVAISIPEKAPIQTIRFGSGKELASKDVQVVKAELNGKLGEASIQPGDVALRGKYLTVGTTELGGAATGWVLPLEITNTDYNPLELELKIGFQLSDGKIIWVQDYTSTVAVPGSGRLNLSPLVWSLSEALNWISPAKLILYFHAPSSSERAFKLMPLTLERFPPLPERIAFQWQSELYVMAVDGSDRTKLVRGYSPAWAPNGTRIAFASVSSTTRGNDYDSDSQSVINVGEIFTMNGDGYKITNSTPGGRVGTHPAWSPNGTKIVFSGSNTSTFGIYTINPDGSGMTKISDLGRNPTWSPDGDRIVFSQFIGFNPSSSGLYIMNANGSQVTWIGTGYPKAHRPAWSPNGTKIAFSESNTSISGIYTINPDGSEVTKISDLGWNPTWSPSGERIAFDTQGRIYVMKADGSSQTNLGFGLNPSWAPALKLTENGLRPLGVAQPEKEPASNSAATSQVLTIKVKRMQAGSGCSATDPGPVQSLDLEKEYLPVVVASENGAAGVPLEALKAQTVASRTFAIYKIRFEPRSPGFDVCDTEADQVYNPSVTVSPQVRKAVEDTRSIVARWNGEVIAAFFVKGDARTAGYVTVNEGKRGPGVKPTTLGSPANSHNRGAMSQDKANELAAQGWAYQRILRYFYGADLFLSLSPH